jgi:hypothetical protein
MPDDSDRPQSAVSFASAATSSNRMIDDKLATAFGYERYESPEPAWRTYETLKCASRLLGLNHHELSRWRRIRRAYRVEPLEAKVRSFDPLAPLSAAAVRDVRQWFADLKQRQAEAASESPESVVAVLQKWIEACLDVRGKVLEEFGRQRADEIADGSLVLPEEMPRDKTVTIVAEAESQGSDDEASEPAEVDGADAEEVEDPNSLLDFRDLLFLDAIPEPEPEEEEQDNDDDDDDDQTQGDAQSEALSAADDET